MYCLILKFIPIAKKTRLTSKWLAKKIIRDTIIFYKKDFLTEILYN